MTIKRMTLPQRATYHALRQLDGEMIVTPDTARPLHALKRRGLVRFARDQHGGKLARLRVNGAQRRRVRRLKASDSRYDALTQGHWIPLIADAIR